MQNITSESLFTASPESAKLIILFQFTHREFAKQLNEQLRVFHWNHSAQIHLQLATELSNSDELLKLIVPAIEKNIPVLFVADQSLHLETLLKAFRYLNHPFIYTSISEKPDDIKYLFNISNTIPNFDEPLISNIMRYDAIGFQIHQINPTLLDSLEDTSSRVYRLGQLKENIKETEPILRDSHLTHLQLSVLKHSEAPAQFYPSQSGIGSEEACQLARYAGISDKLQSLAISGFDPEGDKDGRTTNVIAQLIWYAVDGFMNRRKDHPDQGPSMAHYTIESEILSDDLIFIKSEKTGRWWLKNPFASDEDPDIHRYFPCSYQDYLLACEGEISDNLLKAQHWFSKMLLK